MTSEEMAAFISMLNGKVGGQMSASDVSRPFSPDFTTFVNAMKGGVADPYEEDPIDEIGIMSRNAPELRGVESGNFYKAESLEPRIAGWVRQGKPLTLIQQEIRAALKADGKSTDSKDPYYDDMLNLSKTLYKEYYAATGEVEKARSESKAALAKKKADSEYAKAGIADPSDYSKITEDQLKFAMEPIISRISARYAPIMADNPKDKYAAGRNRVNTERTEKAFDSAERLRAQHRAIVDKQSGLAQRDKSNNDIMKRTVMMLAMENPTLLSNPAIKSILG